MWRSRRLGVALILGTVIAVEINEYWQITGGTGRFSGAKGQGTMTGTVLDNSAVGTFDGTFTLAGSISSVGSLH